MIFASIVLMPAVFLGIVVFLQSNVQKQPTDYSDPLLYISVVIGTAAVIGSTLIYRLRLPGIRQKTDLNEKFNAWKSAFIICIAMIEGATMFAIVCLFITSYDIFLYIAVALLTTQFMNLPTREKVKKDLDLDDEVSAQL
jgi:ABC-type microcin C transport system permease subunit YejB